MKNFNSNNNSDNNTTTPTEKARELIISEPMSFAHIKLPRTIDRLSEERKKIALQKLGITEQFNTLQHSSGEIHIDTPLEAIRNSDDIYNKGEETFVTIHAIPQEHAMLELFWRNTFYKDAETWKKLRGLITNIHISYRKNLHPGVTEILAHSHHIAEKFQSNWNICTFKEDDSKKIFLDLAFAWTDVLIHFISPWVSINKKFQAYSVFLELCRSNNVTQSGLLPEETQLWFKNTHAPYLLTLAVVESQHEKNRNIAKKLLADGVCSFGKVTPEDKNALYSALYTGDDPLINYVPEDKKAAIRYSLTLDNQTVRVQLAEEIGKIVQATHADKATQPSLPEKILPLIARAKNPEEFTVYQNILSGEFEKVRKDMLAKKEEFDNLPENTRVSLGLPILLSLYDKNDYSLVHYLASRGELDLLQWIFYFFSEKQSKQSLVQVDHNNNLPLHYAFMNGHLKMAAAIILNYPEVSDSKAFFESLGNKKDRANNTLLHVLIKQYPLVHEDDAELYKAAIEVLFTIDKDAFVKELTALDTHNISVFEHIITHNQLELINMIFTEENLEQGIVFARFSDLLRQKNQQGKTPLLLAIQLKNKTLTDILLHASKKLGQDYSTGSLKGLWIDEADNQGNTALHYAMIHSDFELAIKLLECGANPFLRNANNQLPLDILLDKTNDLTMLDTILQKSVTLLEAPAISHFIEALPQHAGQLQANIAGGLEYVCKRLKSQFNSNYLQVRREAAKVMLHAVTVARYISAPENNVDNKITFVEHLEAKTRESKFLRYMVKPIGIFLAILAGVVVGGILGATIGAGCSAGWGAAPGAIAGMFIGGITAAALIGAGVGGATVGGGLLVQHYRSKDRALAKMVSTMDTEIKKNDKRTISQRFSQKLPRLVPFSSL